MAYRIMCTLSIAKSAQGLSAAQQWWRSNLRCPKFVCAPMVDQSNLAFRELCRRYEVDLCYTPMIHAGIASRSESYLRQNFKTRPSDRPLVVQLAAHDEIVAERVAARVVEIATRSGNVDGIAYFDLNLGCPQKIARKGKYGAFLLESDLDAAARVVDQLSRRWRTSCKVRLLEDKPIEASIRAYSRLIDAGASMLCVHGRTKAQNKQFSQGADWDAIAAVKAAFPDIPVIGNGGIGSFNDAVALLSRVDAVMSSEMLLDNPALFTNRTVPQRQLAREYLSIACEYDGLVSDARAHLFKMLHGSLCAFPHVRDRLAKKCQSLSELQSIVDDLDALDPDRRFDVRHASPQFEPSRSWYWRHRIPRQQHIAEPLISAARDDVDPTSSAGFNISRAYRKLRRSKAREEQRKEALGQCTGS